MYRVRLTNEQREIQYLDEVELLILDRRPGVRVVPTVSGALHTFAAPVAPQRAVDLREENVLPLLRVKSWDDRRTGRRGDLSAAAPPFPRPAGIRTTRRR